MEVDLHRARINIRPRAEADSLGERMNSRPRAGEDLFAAPKPSRQPCAQKKGLFTENFSNGEEPGLIIIMP